MSARDDQIDMDALQRALFAGALPGEADDLSPAAAARIAGFASDALANREAGEANIVLKDMKTIQGQRRTAIIIANDDMPFLVDSVTNAISARSLTIHRLLHPTLDVARDPNGKLQQLEPADREILPEGRRRESLIYLEVGRLPKGEREPLERALCEILVDVRVSVADWRGMLAKMTAAAESLAEAKISVPAATVMEAKAFLNWLAEDNFTLLGYAAYSFGGALADPGIQPRMEEGLGLLRDPEFELWRGASGFEVLPEALRDFMATQEPILITKANAMSRVHRSAYYDVVSVKRFDGAGEVCGEYRFVGLFTSAALSRSPDHVPIVREKVAAVREALGFDPAGHSGKALTHVLETFPRGELFLTPTGRLAEMAKGMLSLLDRPRPKIFTRVDPFERFVSAVVFIPREDYTSMLRERIGAMLENAYQARLTRYDVELRSEGLARVQFYLATVPGELRTVPEDELDARLKLLVRGWDETLEAALIERMGPQAGEELVPAYGRAFSASYRDQFDAAEAAVDVERLEKLTGPADRDVHFYRTEEEAEHQLRIKIYRLGEIIPLSEMVPVLEAFGFKVIEEFPFDTETGRRGWIHDFLVESPGGEHFDLDFLKAHAEGALRAVLVSEQENDQFNTLVVRCRLRVEEVSWLRAYYRYLRQTVLSYGLLTVVEALGRHPDLTRALVSLFRARFELDLDDREQAMERARQDVRRGLADVQAIDEDRILRLYRELIEATLRTTAFCTSSRTLAFKIDSAAVPGMPAPVPFREIWVYSPRVEGIHLRGGPIARGGLRWSDRRDDFRTEVLGLVKAQMVKNAVIVPTGAKGGFYPKQLPPPGDREAWIAEGTEAYKIFIEALLSLTDNVVDGEVVPPDGVVSHDAADPYLVVAADKGTATFSDIANAISLERGFWLGDAFASGGANGYDHKAMGITARGAWISVQRHFLEMAVDVQKDVVSVIGVGDMSGDVFGNGMLLSNTLKLVAAFDHRHIFIDPDPDPAASWEERRRLFELPRSSWADYDEKLISDGGGVFSRTQKSIELSDPIRGLLGIEAKEVTPNELIRAVLMAEADLLWFGGIGTYVKATGESDAAVGDRANDDIRVDARQLRVKVIGEGANLAITQPGRIAFAQGGGRINTDFIDNSAGVDCSDNEVNIKIALQGPLRSGELPLEARNDLLEDMTEDVAALVLRDNLLQTQALSVAEAGGASVLPAFQRVVQQLEVEGRLDRRVEQLPGDDQLMQRAASGAGMERPELAVLLAYSKMSLYEALVESDIPDDPLLVEDLLLAFPDELRARFQGEIESHSLRREIIATKVANQMVNRGGIALPFELAEEHAMPLSCVGAAFVAARELFGMRDLWRTIDSAEVGPSVRIALHKRSTVGLRLHMSDMIDAMRPGELPSDAVSALGGNVAGLAEKRDTLLRAEPRAALERVRQQLISAGAPEPLINRLLDIEAMDGAAVIARLAVERDADPCSIAAAYTHIGEVLGLDWAHAAAAHLDPSDPWERLLSAGLARDFESMRLDLIAGLTGGTDDPSTAVSAWIERNRKDVERLSGIISRARVSVTTPAMLAHLASQARAVLAT